ncbi:hypothetical protein MXB_4858 [Myxobolus squamalis]|nr:hypothetical protein MXB_4858 [Myxobolus squamalis]
MDEDADFFPTDFNKYFSNQKIAKNTFHEELKPEQNRSAKPEENKIIFNEEDVFKFFNHFDTISLFSQHTCLCQSIIRAFALSMTVLIPLIKMSMRIRKRDLDLLNHICLYLGNVGIFETHAYFCNQLGIATFINSIVNRRSILNILRVDTLQTYYCSYCQYQKVTTTQRLALILDSLCSYASPQVVKQSWFCPACLSDRNSCIESKIRIPKKSTAFMLFTMKGLTSLANVYHQPRQEFELQDALGGKFCIKYFLVQQDNNFSYFESYQGKWRTSNSLYFVSKYSYYDSPPFLAKNIRAIIWHHSKPCIVARSLLTVKSIISHLGSLDASVSTSNASLDILQSLSLNMDSQSNMKSMSCNGNDNANSLKQQSELNGEITKLKPTDEYTLNFLEDFDLTKEINHFSNYNSSSWFQ